MSAIPHGDTVSELRSQLRPELAVIQTNLQPRSAGQRSHDVETELTEVTEARDFMRARLTRLEGEAHG